MTVTERPPSDGWPDVMDVEPADHRALAAIALAAVGTDLAVRSGINGLAGALLTAIVAGGLLASGRIVNRRAWPLLLAVPLLGIGLVSRTSESLLVFDILAAGALLLLGASLARSGDPFDLTIPGLFGRALHALVHGVFAVDFVFTAFRRKESTDAAPSSGRRAAILRGFLLVVPIVLVLGLLLGSADPVFASFFTVPWDAGDVVIHLILLGIGVLGSSVLLRIASAESFAVDLKGPRPLGSVEALMVLGGLVVVFAAFAVSQIVTVVGGADYVRRTAGLSYAEYARNGFFQLLAVAAITLGVLLLVRATVHDRHERWFVVLSEAAVVLTFVVVACALRRLHLYEEAYGLTLLRLFSSAFALWIGVVFVLLGLSLSGKVAPQRAWFVPASLAIALVGLLAANVVNPEALIVGRNVDRFAGSDALDVEHLVYLSDDAVPELLRSLPRMTPDQGALVRASVCGGPRSATDGFWAFNASRDAAIEARNRHCP